MATDKAPESLSEVKVHRPRRHTQGAAELEASQVTKVRNKSVPEFYNNQVSKYTRRDFVYVNPGFVGSVNNVADNSDRARPSLPPTEHVYREQYWVCSKWPHGQKILAIAAGLLFGSVIGLIVTMVRSSNEGDIFPGFLTRQYVQE